MSDAGPTRLAFDDGKAQDALRTIGEVAQALGLKPHVLRYWEQQFPMLEPLKRSGGRRYYRAEDVALVQRIDRLVNREGYTLKGAKQALESGEGNKGGEVASAPETLANPSQVPTEAIAQLKAIRARLAAALDA